MSWFSGFEAIVNIDVPLRDYTWYRLGGPARWFCRPRDEDELQGLMAALRASALPWRVLGRGANVLVRDSGFDGAVIHLAGPIFTCVEIECTRVTASSAADFQKVIAKTFRHNLAGLEAFAGIPGSVGGVVRMNAGGRYGEIQQFVSAVRVLTPANDLVTLPAERVGFAYRHTDLDDHIILAAEFLLSAGSGQDARRRYREIFAEKQGNQPPLAARSAGCVFKNPPGDAAGRILERAGLKGTRVGNAEISTRHANFILAYDGATAADVIALIELARRRVKDSTGIDLQPELEIW